MVALEIPEMGMRLPQGAHFLCGCIPGEDPGCRARYYAGIRTGGDEGLDDECAEKAEWVFRVDSGLYLVRFMYTIECELLH